MGDMEYSEEEDTPESRVEEIRDFVKEAVAGRLLSEYFRVFGKIEDAGEEEEYKRRLTASVYSRAVPWVVPIAGANGKRAVVITKGFLDSLLSSGKEFDASAARDIASMKNLAEILGGGWRYDVFRDGEKTVRGVGTDLEKFIDFFT